MKLLQVSVELCRHAGELFRRRCAFFGTGGVLLGGLIDLAEADVDLFQPLRLFTGRCGNFRRQIRNPGDAGGNLGE